MESAVPAAVPLSPAVAVVSLLEQRCFGREAAVEALAEAAVIAPQAVVTPAADRPTQVGEANGTVAKVAPAADRPAEEEEEEANGMEAQAEVDPVAGRQARGVAELALLQQQLEEAGEAQRQQPAPQLAEG